MLARPRLASDPGWLYLPALWRVLFVGCLLAIVVLLALLYGHRRDAKATVTVNTTNTTVVVADEVNATLTGPFGGACTLDAALCVALPEDATPIGVLVVNDGFAVNATLAGPFGPSCPADQSLCVHLSEDQTPLAVSVTNNDNFTVFVNTSQGPLPVELTNTAFGGNCTASESMCVVFPDDAAPILVEISNVPLNITANVTLNVNPNVTMRNIIVGPLGDRPVNESMSVTISSEQGPLDVEFGTLGNCSLDDALCVTISGQQGPLEVDVVNTVDAVCVVSNAITLADTQPTLNATCAVSNSITLAPTQPTLNATCAVSNTLTLGPTQPTLNATCSVSNSITLAATQPTLNTTCTVANAITLAPTQPTLNTTCTVANAITLAPTQPTLNTTCAVSNSITLAGTQPTLNVSGVFNVSLVAPPSTNISGPLGVRDPASSVSVVVNNANPIRVEFDRNHTDLFKRLRVSIPSTRFDVKLLTNFTESLHFDNVQVSGAGTSTTYSQPRASQFLNVSASTSGRRVRKSLRTFNYQPGKGQLISMTVIPHATPNGVTKRWGYFGDTSGYFFEMADNNRLYTVIRSRSTGVTVDTRTDVTDSVPPGWTVENGEIYVINFAWLGFGAAEFSIFTCDAGYWVLSRDVGGYTVVTTDLPNQPLRYEISNNGTGAASALECVCASIISEAGEGPIGSPNSMNRGTSAVTFNADGATHSLIAVRLNPSYLFATAYATEISISTPTSGTTSFLYSVIYRPTVAGAALSWQSIPDSPLQFAIPVVTNTVTGGQVMSSGYIIGTSTNRPSLANTPQSVFLGSLVNGTPLEMHVCARQTSSANMNDYYAAIGITSAY